MDAAPIDVEYLPPQRSITIDRASPASQTTAPGCPKANRSHLGRWRLLGTLRDHWYDGGADEPTAEFLERLAKRRAKSGPI